MKTSAAIAPASSGLRLSGCRSVASTIHLRRTTPTAQGSAPMSRRGFPLNRCLVTNVEAMSTPAVAHGPCGPYAALPTAQAAPCASRRRYAGRPAGRASGPAGPARTPPTRGARGSRPTPRASAPSPSPKRRSASSYAASSSSRPDDDARLVRGPGAELGAARADREVGVDVGPRERRRGAVDADLPLERVPREEQRDPRVAGQLGALAGAGVGVEDEAVLVDALEQHQPGAGALCPSGGAAETLATTMALGSCSPAARASSYQRRNIAIGSGSRSDSTSPAREYSSRAAATESSASVGLPRSMDSQHTGTLASETAYRHNAPHG